MTRHMKVALATAALAAAAFSLVGCSSTNAVDVAGTWGNENQSGEPWLTFAEDGRFSGSDGCNQVFGSYTVSGDTVSFGEMGSTLMFCEGVDTWLSTAASADVTDNTMVVRDAANAEIGTLERSE